MTERAFLQLVRDTARLFGWLEYHTADSRRSASGYPDLTLVKGNRVLFVELKTATGKVRAEQIVWAERLAAVGGAVEYHQWRPTTAWELIQETLR